ncbi:methyltransferase family protein [Actinomycetospora succinea]|uniref:Methyltransferase family protein n=1 Tax=Actinomycetospora succinea TaxID=663603 RepID=A0A4R6VB76_9PSEU|nr:methyltransferase domain-containing protein [Actinomycetospora succinea]TDQ58885.1 methyltransferase family protein [Actinomycetospora succinea]
MERATYTIAGGATDADRLARQATVMASSTLRFLERAGLRGGDSCLDVGCGDGQTTIAMARAVGTTGRVTGVDLDDGALEIARRAADDAGVPASFLHADAGRDGLPDTGADLAFARLVLSHLVDPMAVVRAMASAVRPGGVVAVEDIFTPTLRSEPPVPALDDLADVYAATVRFHGGDPTIGPRLAAHLTAAGLVDVHEETVENPMTTATQKMFLAELLDNMRDAVASAGTATPDRLDTIRAAVAAGAQRPDTVFFQARMHQVSARRPQ